MKPDQERQLARNLLTHRAAGYSISYVLRRSLKHYAILLSLGAALLAVAVALESPALRPFFAWAGGMLMGAVLRDAGWFRRIKRNWPFTEMVTDWAKVERIAQGSERQQGQASAG